VGFTGGDPETAEPWWIGQEEPQAVKLVRMFLEGQHESTLRGWRAEFVSGVVGQIGFPEYARACAALDNPGDFVEHWKQFASAAEIATSLRGVKRKGEWMCLADLDPAVFGCYEALSRTVINEFKGGVQFFDEVCESLNKKPGQGLSFEDFTEGCRILGVKLPSAMNTRRALLYGFDLHSYGRLTEESFAFLEGGRSVLRRASAAIKRTESVRTKVAEVKKRSAGLREVAAFRKALNRQFGNTIRAWRVALNEDGNSTLSKAELFKACQKIDGYRGDVRTLWGILDVEQQGIITMAQIDYRAAHHLAHFRHFCKAQYGMAARPGSGTPGRSSARADGPCVRAFEFMETPARESPRSSPRNSPSPRVSKAPRTPRRKKKVKLARFQSCLNEMGFQASGGCTSAMLFELLTLPSSQCLTREDCVFLDAWRPPDQLLIVDDPAAIEEFWAAVLGKFESRSMAWRQALDIDESNYVAWEEFLEFCKVLEWTSKEKLAAVWQILDNDCNGFLSLREWDPQADQLFTSFKTKVDERFGSVTEFFEAVAGGLGVDAFVSAPEFKKACIHLGLSKEEGQTLYGIVDADCTGGVGKRDIMFLEEWTVRRKRPNSGGPTRCSTRASIFDENSPTLSYPARGTLPTLPSLPDEGYDEIEETQTEFPRCTNKHYMVWTDQFDQEEYKGVPAFKCDKCNLANIGARWFCAPCRVDYCSECWAPPAVPRVPIQLLEMAIAT